jgi:hypothetical protein
MNPTTSSAIGVTGFLGSYVFGYLARSARVEASHSSTALAREDQLSKAEFMEFASALSLGIALGIGLMRVSESRKS